MTPPSHDAEPISPQSDPPRALGESDGEFVAAPNDPLRKGPAVDDMEARRVRSAIEGRLFSGPATPIRVGRYRITGRIGAGGMGVVYRAHDPELARDVAVKLMHPGAETGKESKTARARLVREARAMARLAHPNVIHVYDVGAVEDGVFIAMELIEGESLASWRKGASRAWREVLAVCLDAGRGLAAAHAAGVVHRDFKPENVLVGADGRARVGDFGLAGGAGSSTGAVPALGATDAGEGSESSSTLDDAAGRALMPALTADPEPETSSLDQAAISGVLTRTGMLLGTPKYMAPEQEVGGMPSPLADQFSFCVALYEALYGHPPFEGENVAEYRHSVHKQYWLPAPPHTKVKAWVHTQILRGLSVDPKARHDSMEALIERLEAALSDPSRVRRQRRRRRLFGAGLLGTLGLAGAVGMVAVALSASPEPDDTKVSNPGLVAQSPPATEPLTPEPEREPEAAVPAETPPPEPAELTSGDATPIAAEPTPGTVPTEPKKAVSDGRKLPRKTDDRGYCYFIEDLAIFLTRRTRKRTYLRHGGQCYKCQKGPSSIAYNPSDCRGFQACHKLSDDAQCA